MIPRTRAIIIAALAAMLPVQALAQDAPRQQDESPRQVLFVGNSYFYYNNSLHNHVRRMAVEGLGVPLGDLDYRSITISGGSLAHHPIAHYLTPGAIGYDTPFDVVVLQGHSAAALSERRAGAFNEAVSAASEQIEATGAQVALYMTHAYGDGHKDFAADNTDQIADLYTAAGEAAGAVVIPVGLAFAEAQRRDPDLVLHQTYDDSHPNVNGSYLAAATVYATLYGQSPQGLEYDYYGAVEPEMRVFLQEVAADTVEAFQAR
jgi:hypothetical protein